MTVVGPGVAQGTTVGFAAPGGLGPGGTPSGSSGPVMRTVLVAALGLAGFLVGLVILGFAWFVPTTVPSPSGTTTCHVPVVAALKSVPGDVAAPDRYTVTECQRRSKAQVLAGLVLGFPLMVISAAAIVWGPSRWERLYGWEAARPGPLE